MRHGYSVVREAVKQFPLPLLSLEDKLRKVADLILPYSTGIEIECNSSLNGEFLLNRCGLMEVDCSHHEQRIRLKPGVEGMASLFKSCKILQENYELNNESGIHYHIDCTDISSNDYEILRDKYSKNPDFILKALKSWNYQGNYNSWKVGSHSGHPTAVRFNGDFRTVEFRIGEMTFDYELIMRRIISCQNIVRRMKSSLKSPYPKGKTKVAKAMNLYIMAC
jgi:hypothetical protein